MARQVGRKLVKDEREPLAGQGKNLAFKYLAQSGFLCLCMMIELLVECIRMLSYCHSPESAVARVHRAFRMQGLPQSPDVSLASNRLLSPVCRLTAKK
jgi:hypothetical protein